MHLVSDHIAFGQELQVLAHLFLHPILMLFYHVDKSGSGLALLLVELIEITVQ